LGLVIGIKVRRQLESFMSEVHNPQGSREEINDRFAAFIEERFAYSCSPSVYCGKQYFIFDVQIGYDWSFSKQNEVYLAIASFILDNFSHAAGIEMNTFWSG
jgi:hypothetical protein